MEQERQARESADSRVKPTQANIRSGHYFINFRYGPDLSIFGEILDYKTLGIDEEEQKYINEFYEQPHVKYYRPSHAFSVACPMGECGDVHLSEIDVIMGKDLFDFYQENDWVKPPERK
jgi:hypothetical protein